MPSPRAEMIAPRLFISYSHDSPEHQDQVRALADHLRQDGIDVLIDQYNPTPPDGWPMWMDREVQKADFIALVCTETYLKRVEGREVPGKGRGVLWEAKLIYNLLYGEDVAFQRFIPVLLDSGASSNIPLPVRGLTSYRVQTDQGYEDFYRHLTGQPRYEKPALGKLKSLPAIQPQSYPASLSTQIERPAPTSIDQRNRLQMLKRVRLDWIDGVLKQSLYQVARIELGLQITSDAVELPLKAIVQTPDRPPSVIPKGAAINQVFDDHGAALLILGAPGTGKTTLLLELAEQLLNRAEHDDSQPIPVVFNLSSWAVRRQPLSRWLISELNERNDVPNRLAKQWVESEQIIPLLDGLDEVAVDQRQPCVKAINDFRRDHGLLPIVVCSRITDYEAVGIKLRLRNAIIVQSLSRPEVEHYLRLVGEPLQALRAAIEKDPSIWEILETPLMLWVAMLGYHDTSVEWRASTLEQRRGQLFRDFVNAMLHRRSEDQRYNLNEILPWLCWLAAGLRQNEQTVFYLENLSEKWLRTRLQKWLSKTGMVAASAFCGGAIAGLIDWIIAVLIFWLIPHLGPHSDRIRYSFGGITLCEDVAFKNIWNEQRLLIDVTLGLIVGLFSGGVGICIELKPPEKIQIRLSGMSNRVRRARRAGLTAWLISGLIICAIWMPIESDLIELILALIVGFFMSLPFGLLPLFSGEDLESRRIPNQGTRRSVNFALIAGLFYGLPLGLASGLFVALLDPCWPWGGLLRALRAGFSIGLLPGLLGWLVGGGLFALRHFVLRVVLWKNRLAPLQYVRFLEYAVERLFLRRVGGGYIFVHRMLMEYFASLPQPPSTDQIGMGPTTAPHF